MVASENGIYRVRIQVNDVTTKSGKPKRVICVEIRDCINLV